MADEEEEAQTEEKPKKGSKKVTREPEKTPSESADSSETDPATDFRDRRAKKQKTAEQRPRAASIKNDRDPLIGWDAQQGPPRGANR